MKQQLTDRKRGDCLAPDASIAPSWATESLALYTGDAREMLSQLPDAFADCVVTSPPYWGLRDYGFSDWNGGDAACHHSTGRGSNTPQPRQPNVPYPASAAHRGGRSDICTRCGAQRAGGQYGLEPTPQEYVNTLRSVFRELHRVLKPTGTVWLNLGDTYSCGRAETASDERDKRGIGTADEMPRAKNLIGMPWRTALALQADGWTLRNAIVWAKKNPMPESVQDRLSTTYEFVFLLVKEPRYHFDLDSIRVPLARPEALGEGIVVGGGMGAHAAIGPAARRLGKHIYGAMQANAGFFARHVPGSNVRCTGRRHDSAHARGKNPGDVWRLSSRPLHMDHCAAFPIDLPLRCIAAGCPEGGVVLDPFSGAGTTGLAALQLRRQYIGIELYERYNQVARERISRYLCEPSAASGAPPRSAPKSMAGHAGGRL